MNDDYKQAAEYWQRMYEQICKEIVRCGDCKHLNNVEECPCGFLALEKLDDFFCAWGERLDE